MQVASSEWFLGVQIQKFENYNVEIVRENYCCCDHVTCKPSIAEVQEICMSKSCQPYFIIHIRDCSCNGTCSLDTTYQLNNESNSSLLNGVEVLNIPFKEMELSVKVSTKSVHHYIALSKVYTIQK